MTDVAADGEVRRSGRATKGKHTGRIDIEPHTPVPRKKKEQVPRELVSGDGEGGADEVIRCVCGADTEDEDDSRMMVQCEKCLVWQHNICLGITKNKIPDNYFCELCRPDMHEDFLRRVAAGEKPWERGKGRRKSRKSFGNPRSRKGGSEAASEAPPSVDAGTPRPRDTSHAGPMDIDGRSPAPALISDGYVRPERTNGQTGDKMDVEETGKQRSRESTVDANPEMAARHSRDSTEEMLPPTTPLRREFDPSKKRKSRDSNVELHIDTAQAQNYPSNVQHPNDLRTPRRPSVTPIEKPSTGKAPRKKRRVSEAGAMSPTKGQSAHEEGRKKIANYLENSISEAIKKKSAKLNIPAEQTTPEHISHLASAIENATFLLFPSRPGEFSDHYKSKARSIAYNLARNDELLKNIVAGMVTPEQLANMSTEDMANKELQKMNEQLRRQSDLAHTLTSDIDSGPRIRRTHKGEEFVDDTGAGYTSFKTALPEKKLETPTTEKGEDGSPTGPAETPTSQTAPTPTTEGPKHEHREGEMLRKFSIDKVWNKIEPGEHQQHRPSFSLPLASPRHVAPLVTPEMAKIDRDIDNLLSVEPEHESLGTPPYSPAPEDALDSGEWKGRVSMQATSDFDAVIRLVAGSNLGRDSNWLSLLGSTIVIDGRIAIDRAAEYLSGQRYSRSNCLSVLSISPRDQLLGTPEFNKLFDYFKVKQRFGVVGHHPITAIRDTYLVPLDRNEPLPSFLETIEPKVIPEAPRQDRMLLLFHVVVRDQIKNAVPPPAQKRENSISQHGTPMNHGYQGSPIQHTPIQQTPQTYEQSPSQRPAQAYQQPAPQPAQQPVQAETNGLGFPPLPRTTKTFNFNAWPELQNSLPYLEDIQIDCINRIVEKYPEAASNPQLLSDLLVHEMPK